MTPGAQFPELTPENLGERYVDPAVLDRPVTAELEVPPPSFIEIAVAAVMAGFLIYATWSGLFFGSGGM